MLSPLDEVKIKDAVKTIQDLQQEFKNLRSSIDKVAEQIVSEEAATETPSPKQSEQFHAKNAALQRENDALRRQLERQRAEQLHKYLTLAKEKIAQLETERNVLQEEIASLRKNNDTQQQTIQQQKDRIESDNKRLEAVPAELDSARTAAQEEFMRSLVESVGVRQLSQLLQSYGRNSENPSRIAETAEEQIGRKVVTFLTQQKLQPLHQPNQLIRLRSESDLAQYELPSHTRFSTERLLVVAIPGIVGKNTVLAKAKLREWDEEDDKERTQPTSETAIPEPGETAKGRDGTLSAGRISSAESGTDITDLRSEKPEGKS